MRHFNRRVVVTGMGVVSPIGNDSQSFWENLFLGNSGKAYLDFQGKDVPVRYGFPVRNFDAKRHHVHFMDPFIQYAVAATDEALKQACLEPKNMDRTRIGISVSSSKGGMHTFEQFQNRLRRNPSAILGARVYANIVPNFAAQWIARRWKIQGPARCYVAACATGTVALCEGATMVASQEVDYCIAGATDASLVPLLLAGYHRMKVLAKEDIRPFDRSRDGFLIGEGAAILILESFESAKARGIKPLAEIAGYQYASDGKELIHFDKDQGALAYALKELTGQLRNRKPDYINAHGTATRAGDAYEISQIAMAFGKDASRIPISSTKSITGHLLGAAGAVEALVCVLALQKGWIPPTVGWEESEPEWEYDFVAPPGRKAQLEHAFSISMGFGGHVAVVGFRRVDT